MLKNKNKFYLLRNCILNRYGRLGASLTQFILQSLALSCYTLLLNLLANSVLITSVEAAQYQHCYPVKKTRVISDPGYHPNAYDDGYREGAESARKKDAYQARSAGGEFSRGFDDGFNGRPYTEQKNTVPNRTESYTASQCKTYYYNEKDPINKILDQILNDFQRDLERDWKNNQ